MVEYFGGGASRGSNEWINKCDAIVVLGTPRVSPSDVRGHLIAIGSLAARLSEDQADWTLDYWSGVTESGRRVTVRTPHYRNHDWHRAYCALVLSELRQAIGRARSVLSEGMPAYVVTTENVGETLSDLPCAPLTDAQYEVLGCLYSRRGRRIVGKAPEIAKKLCVSPTRVRILLSELAETGRTRKVGDRSGWLAATRE